MSDKIDPNADATVGPDVDPFDNNTQQRAMDAATMDLDAVSEEEPKGKGPKIVLRFKGKPGWYMPDPPVPGRDLTEADAAAIEDQAMVDYLTKVLNVFEVASPSWVSKLPKQSNPPAPRG